VKPDNETRDEQIDRLERQIRHLYIVAVVMLVLNVVFLVGAMRMR
jgi:hypothetical protein